MDSPSQRQQRQADSPVSTGISTDTQPIGLVRRDGSVAADAIGGWAFYAIGEPAPQGSKRHVGRGVMIESSKRVRPWREAVAAAAFGAGECLDGPLAVAMIFTLRRPKSARRIDTAPFRTPDLSKLARAVEDAITDVGLWADDARVAEYARLAKTWPGFDSDSLPTAGVVVAAVELTDAWRSRLSDLLGCALVDAKRRYAGRRMLQAECWEVEV
jgi:Holliday junction resolvase RusA-like endonuclease